MEQLEFESCMERMKDGDKSALKEIYEAYLSYIYTIVYGVVQSRENAEDITSEFFIKLWNMSDTYNPKTGSHKGFLATIARNMAIDFVRKTRREVFPEEMPDEAADGVSVEDEVIGDVSLQEALDALSDKEREVVTMKVLSEMTFQEIADTLLTPLGTITWRYRTAMEKLRRYGYE